MKLTQVGVLFAFTFLGAAVIQLTQAQGLESCADIATSLETPEITPTIVENLPVCVDERGVEQCCTVDFIQDTLNATEHLFIRGLRDQLSERFQDVEEIADELREYLEGEFLTGYFSSIGDLSQLGGGSELIDEFISDLRDNLEFDPRDDDVDMDDPDSSNDDEETTDGGFSITGFLQNVTSQLEDRVVDAFTQSPQVAQCIRRVVESRISAQRMQAQAEALQQIRRVLASIETLRSFIRNFTEDLAGFRPLQQCIDRIVDLNTCGRCVATRPPFCRNVCWAVARACYSPFNDALEDQLEVLWEVVRRILESADEAIEDLNENKGLLDDDNAAILNAISSECGVSLPQQSKRQSGNEDDDDIPRIPPMIETKANGLSGGPFDDDDDNEDNDTPGICRLLNLEQTDCWDGEAVINNDIDDFDFDDIDDQVNNPAIDLDEDELRQQAESIGSPVSMALSDPSFAQIAPLGLVIPQPGENNGATSVVLSFTLFTLALVAGVFVM